MTNEESIGNLNHVYDETIAVPRTGSRRGSVAGTPEGYEYYNVNNIYYKLGYWEDIYRVGIVYVLNDYTLSPVFNIRGINSLGLNTMSVSSTINKPVPIEEDYSISGTNHNAKGVFRIENAPNIYHRGGEIKPIGLKFRFHNNVIEGIPLQLGLKDLTKGFFFVRQKRIPTIIAQAIGAGTSKHGKLPTININSSGSQYILESFLMQGNGNKPRLGSSFTTLQHAVNNSATEVFRNALLCPEADLRSTLYNTYFNSSEYILEKHRFQSNSRYFRKTSGNDSHYYLDSPTINIESPISPLKSFTASLLLIEPGIDLIKKQFWNIFF